MKPALVKTVQVERLREWNFYRMQNDGVVIRLRSRWESWRTATQQDVGS